MKKGFDHEKYLAEQSKYILERVNRYDKLYLEFGGKLMFDLHAKRVLPGYDENAKIKLLKQLKDKLEIIICVYAMDIEMNKLRGDFGITYDMEVLRLIDDLRTWELDVNSVVITRFEGQASTQAFINKLERRGIKTYTHKSTVGYPTDVDLIVSDEGYGANPYIETSKPIVVVTAPGPGSGKLATCLSQMYHDHKRNRVAGYSKFETFPVWNVPLKHPLNIAYEAATADLKDVNMMDSFHFDAYGISAVNYNRDMEMFPVIRRIIEKITGQESIYKSPTDMGVNRVGYGIIDDEVVAQASRQEIIRRYFKTACDYKKGNVELDTFQRTRLLMEELKLRECDRIVVQFARDYAATHKHTENESLTPTACIALQLEDGTIITGKTSALMGCSAAVILNAIKYLASIQDEIHLLSPLILEPMIRMKSDVLGNKCGTLSAEEVLMALSICAATNPTAEAAISNLGQLKGCQAHSTAILSNRDEQTFRKLGMDITCDAQFPNENLYYID
ncbi:MAG: DUF1846 domain-containing protein [Oscillospiraceae bacterium]